MVASTSVILIVALLIGAALIVIATLMPRIAPKWTIRYSPFVGQVVAALARGRPLNAENLSSPDWQAAAALDAEIEGRVRRSDFDGTERYLESLSTTDRSEGVRFWAGYILSELHLHGVRSS